MSKLEVKLMVGTEVFNVGICPDSNIDNLKYLIESFQNTSDVEKIRVWNDIFYEIETEEN